MLRLTHLNFIRTPAPLLGWRSVVLGLGLAALASSAWRLNQEAQKLAGFEAQLAQAQPVVAEKPLRSASQLRERDAQVALVGEAVRQINFPVENVIKGFRVPADIHVALLALDLTGKSSLDDGNAAGNPKSAALLKIAAEAKTLQDMTNYVAFLSDRPWFRSVYLIKHEINLVSAEKPYRFQLEVQWAQ